MLSLWLILCGEEDHGYVSTFAQRIEVDLLSASPGIERTFESGRKEADDEQMILLAIRPSTRPAF